MRPFITLLTSTELQDALENELSEDEMGELQTFRDQVQEEFRQHLDAVTVMEELYGEQWTRRDLQMWVVDNGDGPSTSSPILLNEDTEEDALFTALHMLAKNLIRQNPADSELVESGKDKLDAVAALLAHRALNEVMQEERFTEVMDAIKERDEKLWEAVKEYMERWNHEDETLIEWLEGDG